MTNFSDEPYEILRRAAETEVRRNKKKVMLAKVDAAWARSSHPGITIDEINEAIRELRDT